MELNRKQTLLIIKAKKVLRQSKKTPLFKEYRIIDKYGLFGWQIIKGFMKLFNNTILPTPNFEKGDLEPQKFNGTLEWETPNFTN